MRAAVEDDSDGLEMELDVWHTMIEKKWTEKLAKLSGLVSFSVPCSTTRTMSTE